MITTEIDLILHQCADLLSRHGFNCYMSNDKLAVEVSQSTPNGCYVTFTEYVKTIKEAQQLIVDYDKGVDFYEIQRRG